MLVALETLTAEAKKIAAGFDADVLDGNAAKRVVALAAELERYAVALKTLAMRRVDVTGAWSAGADRSAERWLARVTGVSIGEAAGVVATGERLEQLTATTDALRAGKLSGRQAALVAEAATLQPSAERDLLAIAKSASLTKLRDEATKIRVAAVGGDAQAKIDALRSYRSWTDRDGAYRYEGSMTAGNGARFDTVLDAYTDKVFRDARGDGIRESRDAYAADALMRMVEAAAGDGADSDACTKSRLHGVLVVDAHAYVRDRLGPGELCELVGVGPIDLATAKAMLGEAIIDVAISDGVDVRGLAHAGRHPTMRQWLALYARGAICGSSGCGRRDNLQADHLPEYHKTQRTSVEDLMLKCPGCHYNKTFLKYVDGPLQADGTCALFPPGTPIDDEHGPDPPDTS